MLRWPYEDVCNYPGEEPAVSHVVLLDRLQNQGKILIATEEVDGCKHYVRVL